MSHVAITGASSGIGEALAREFAKAGHTLTLVARRKELLETLARSCGVKCRVVQQDLSEPSRAADWVGPAEAELGPIEVLVNNAGMQPTGSLASSDPTTGLKTLAINLETPLVLTRRVLPGMLARRSGTVVNLSSMAAFAAPRGMSWYGASKAGLGVFSEVLRGELRGSGVHVVAVYPGGVKTAMGEAGYAAYGGYHGLVALFAPQGTPEVLARKIRRAVEKRRPRVIYPGVYAVSRLVPWLALWVASFAPLSSDPSRG